MPSILSRTQILTNNEANQNSQEAANSGIRKEATSDQPVVDLWEGSSSVVRQGRHWSSALIWTGVVLLGSTVIWAFNAKIDQTITVRGRLVPSGRVRDVESPSSGVVSDVFVSEGDQVIAGQALFSVEAKGLDSRRRAIIKTLKLLSM